VGFCAHGDVTSYSISDLKFLGQRSYYGGLCSMHSVQHNHFYDSLKILLSEIMFLSFLAVFFFCFFMLQITLIFAAKQSVGILTQTAETRTKFV
jgi:hypothetical protein